MVKPTIARPPSRASMSRDGSRDRLATVLDDLHAADVALVQDLGRDDLDDDAVAAERRRCRPPPPRGCRGRTRAPGAPMPRAASRSSPSVSSRTRASARARVEDARGCAAASIVMRPPPAPRGTPSGSSRRPSRPCAANSRPDEVLERLDLHRQPVRRGADHHHVRRPGRPGRARELLAVDQRGARAARGSCASSAVEVGVVRDVDDRVRSR